MQKNYCFIFLNFLFCVWLHAQKGTVASGIEATGSAGSVSASIGQIDFNYQSGSNGNLNQGLQQPYELDVTLGISNATVNLETNVYPNPAQTNLTLTISDYNSQSYSYFLYDATGKLILQNSVQSNSTPIDLKELSNGIYLLSVFSGNILEKQFRVVKHQ
jgi:opacity protein-like surface antigen